MSDKNESALMLTRVLAFVCAAACLLLAFFLPWAEIGLPFGDKLPSVAIGPFLIDLNAMHLNGWYDAAHGQLKDLPEKLKNDPNLKFYVYSFLLGVAMIAAAIGLNLIGREESEEKTVLPVKK